MKWKRFTEEQKAFALRSLILGHRQRRSSGSWESSPPCRTNASGMAYHLRHFGAYVLPSASDVVGSAYIKMPLCGHLRSYIDMIWAMARLLRVPGMKQRSHLQSGIGQTGDCDRSMRASVWIALLLAVLTIGGCGIGPPLLRRDRLDYQIALSESWKKEMLLNILKMRYADAPVFLEVTSIINQHSLQGDFRGLGVLFGNPWSSRQEYGGGVTAYDRPTVTYAPLQGEKFARSLTAPIPPMTILSMIQSGWSADFVLRLTCESINGVRNSSHSAFEQRVADPKFEELITAMRRIQISDTIAVRIEKKEKQEVAKVVIGRQLKAGAAKDAARVREILGVAPDVREFQLTHGSGVGGPDELGMLSRSMLQILIELGGCINVPGDHLKTGRAAPAVDFIPGTRLMTIHSGRFPPSDTAASISYKGHWFWVADNDFASKRMLSLLMMFFSLTETGNKGVAPAVTIPVG